MRKFAILPLAACVFLSGCSFNGNQLDEAIEELVDYSYIDATVKGRAILDIPETLVVSEGEADLLNKARSITYHIEEKSTPKVTYIDADISLSESDFKFQSYTDEKESLMSNGKGWYHFTDNPLPFDLKLNTIHKFISEAMADPEAYEIEKSRPKITFNDKEFNTTSYELVFDKNYLKGLSAEVGVEIRTLKLRFFINKENLLVIQYESELKKNTANEDFIAAGLSGEILFNSINSIETKAPKPHVLKVYTTPADFFIELLLGD